MKTNDDAIALQRRHA